MTIFVTGIPFFAAALSLQIEVQVYTYCSPNGTK